MPDQDEWKKDYIKKFEKKFSATGQKPSSKEKQEEKTQSSERPKKRGSGKKKHEQTAKTESKPKERQKGSRRDRKRGKKNNRDKFKPVINTRKSTSQPSGQKTSSLHGGTIQSIDPDSTLVSYRDEEYKCKLSPRMRPEKMYVGDHVRMHIGANREGIIEKLDQRKNQISMPHRDADGKEQILAVNVNQVVIVVSTKEPLLRTDWLDQHIILCERRGFKPLICCSKTDLADDNSFIEQLDAYKRIGYNVIFTSATLPSSISALRKMIRGKVTVMTGHVGSGKTMLTHMVTRKSVLAPFYMNGNGNGADLDEPSGDEISSDWDDLETTLKARAYRLPDGGLVIDTPGSSSYELLDVARQDLKKYFREFRKFGNRCAIPYCMHVDENGCKIKKAAQTGEIADERYNTYLRLMETFTAAES